MGADGGPYSPGVDRLGGVMSARSLKTRMLERLVMSPGWLTPATLAAGLSTSRPAIEDALADLVIEKKADYRI